MSFISVPGFDDPYSHVYVDKDGQLLAAYVAADGQYRFPQRESAAGKYLEALILFEDKDFFLHHGISLKSIGGALIQNIRAGRIVRGGSTITQQTIRLARKDPARTYIEKIVEAVYALKLDFTQSKKEILQAYIGHAPFGGNIVGADTAAWRLFGKRLSHLTWSEAALLAVLPNAPSSLHVGKRRAALKLKRDRLLVRLARQNHWPSETLTRRQLEPLPEKPIPFPQDASHMTLSPVSRTSANTHWHKTHLDRALQRTVQGLVDRHVSRLENRVADHAAALIVDVKTGQVKAYVGNTLRENMGHHNDMIRALRSPGSTLKPFLYEAALERGLRTTESLVADVPTNFSGFHPRNYFKKYLGAVPMRDALTRSLNVPAVELLSEYGVDPFLSRLKILGFNHLDRDASHYGLSLVLGGAEVTPWELARAYLHVARSAQGQTNMTPVHFEGSLAPINTRLKQGSSYLVSEVLTGTKRPGTHTHWDMTDSFTSQQHISWKTGTSHGFRDAWSVGYTKDNVVVVWVGNADGHGNAELIGSVAAAPLFFDIWSRLPTSTSFEAGDVRGVKLCSHSGHIAGPNCGQTVDGVVAESAVGHSLCAHCEQIWLDGHGERVNETCAAEGLHTRKAFLPPAAWRNHLPEGSFEQFQWSQACLGDAREQIELTYPPADYEILLATDLDGEEPSFQATVAYQGGGRLYWYLDKQFMGYTKDSHVLSLSPRPGQHQLDVFSEKGAHVARSFVVKGR